MGVLIFVGFWYWWLNLRVSLMLQLGFRNDYYLFGLVCVFLDIRNMWWQNVWFVWGCIFFCLIFVTDCRRFVEVFWVVENFDMAGYGGVVDKFWMCWVLLISCVIMMKWSLWISFICLITGEGRGFYAYGCFEQTITRITVKW